MVEIVSSVRPPRVSITNGRNSTPTERHSHRAAGGGDVFYALPMHALAVGKISVFLACLLPATSDIQKACLPCFVVVFSPLTCRDYRRSGECCYAAS